MEKSIAFFDFDGTITHKDTFIEFIKFSKGNAPFYAGFVLLSPILVLYKMKLIPNWRAKEIVITFFFKDTLLSEFESVCKQFNQQLLPKIIRKEAVQKLQWHLDQNHKVVIVSASPINWLLPFSNRFGVELIGTQLEVKHHTITGKIEGNNCFGIEKANRIQAQFSLKDYQHIYAYGDSSGDKEMLALATHPFFRKF
jgi:HAD superfamily hydrolase (TIGR01490 family)